MVVLNFDKSRCSSGIQFLLMTAVLFPAQRTNDVVFLTPELLERSAFNKRTQLVFLFTNQYGPQAEPIIGIFHTFPHLDDLWLKENPEDRKSVV